MPPMPLRCRHRAAPRWPDRHPRIPAVLSFSDDGHAHHALRARQASASLRPMSAIARNRNRPVPCARPPRIRGRAQRHVESRPDGTDTGGVRAGPHLRIMHDRRTAPPHRAVSSSAMYRALPVTPSVAEKCQPSTPTNSPPVTRTEPSHCSTAVALLPSVMNTVAACGPAAGRCLRGRPAPQQQPSRRTSQRHQNQPGFFQIAYPPIELSITSTPRQRLTHRFRQAPGSRLATLRGVCCRNSNILIRNSATRGTRSF